MISCKADHLLLDSGRGSGKVFDCDEMLEFLRKKAGNLVVVDTDQACAELGSSKVANMVLLGAAGRAGIISADDLKAAVKQMVKPDFYELNVRAIEWSK